MEIRFFQVDKDMVYQKNTKTILKNKSVKKQLNMAFAGKKKHLFV